MFCWVLCGSKTPLVHQATFGSNFRRDHLLNINSTGFFFCLKSHDSIPAKHGMKVHLVLLHYDFQAIAAIAASYRLTCGQFVRCAKPHIGWEHDVIVLDVWQCVVVSTRWGGRNVLQMAWCIMTRYESHKSVCIEHCLSLWFGSSLLPWSWLVELGQVS